MTSQQWAYLAGFFDGEGCVEIRCRLTEPGGARSRYEPRLTFTQASRPVLDQTCAWLGYGQVRLRSRCRPDRRPCWELVVYGRRNLAHLVAGLLPHAIVKREQLLVLQELLARPHWRGRSRRLPEAERALRQAILDRLRQLKSQRQEKAPVSRETTDAGAGKHLKGE